jgi:hypothetical protein
MCLISQWYHSRITIFETVLMAINLRKITSTVPYNSNCMGRSKIWVYEKMEIFKRGRTGVDEVCSRQPTITRTEMKEQIDQRIWDNRIINTPKFYLKLVSVMERRSARMV